jgi:DNA-binding MarR family transcriptional regulator
MKQSDRLAKVQRERSKALARAGHLAELQAAGAARAVALHEAEVQLERIAQRLPEALSAGLSVAEVARSVGVSRQTVYELKARYGDVGDLRLAVLQAILLLSPATTSDIAERLSRDGSEVGPIIDELLEREWIDFDVEQRIYASDDAEAVQVWSCTPAGLQAFEHWTAEIVGELE